jgi:hypothetical protein
MHVKVAQLIHLRSFPNDLGTISYSAEREQVFDLVIHGDFVQKGDV